MPRYFFHFSDAKHWFTDRKGHDLSGLRAARQHAIKDVRDLKAALCQRHIQDLSEWTMVVADARGNFVYVLGFDLQPQGRNLLSDANKNVPPRRGKAATPSATNSFTAAISAATGRDFRR